MGDTFFKTFFISIFAMMGLVGFLMFMRLEKEVNDSREQRYYMESRGRTKVPYSWRDKIGKGI